MGIDKGLENMQNCMNDFKNKETHCSNLVNKHPQCFVVSLIIIVLIALGVHRYFHSKHHDK